jgi:hypothetical protein
LKKTIFSIILSFIFAFQAYGANKTLKPIMHQKPASTAVMAKPSGTMTLTIKKPDLIVQKFVLSPGSVQNGERVKYELIINNIGGPSKISTMRSSFQSSYGTGRSDYRSVPNPGQSLTFNGELSVGISNCTAITWTVKLDFQNKIIESNENNNTASYSASIQGRPMIGFCTNTHQEPPCPDLFINGAVDKDIYIGFEVYNFGCAVSPAGAMELSFPGQWPQTVPIPPIQPGKFFPFVTYMQWSTPGVKNGEIILKYNQSNVKIYRDRIKHKVNVVVP